MTIETVKSRKIDGQRGEGQRVVDDSNIVEIQKCRRPCALNSCQFELHFVLLRRLRSKDKAR
jgi:hypothetical protein